MNQEERRQRRQKDTKSAVIVCVIVVLILLVLVAGGVFLVGRLLPKGGGQNEGTDGTELPGENVAATEEVTEQPQTEVQTDPVEEQAAQLVSQMTLEDKIAQMFVITPNALTGYASGVTAAGDTTKEAYQSRPVGGIVYMADNLTDPEQTTTMLSNMQEIARERTGLPVFLCVDEEGGSVARIAGNDAFGVTDVGNMSDIGASGDVQNAYNAGSTIGSYLAALGFNVDFAGGGCPYQPGQSGARTALVRVGRADGRGNGDIRTAGTFRGGSVRYGQAFPGTRRHFRRFS